MADNTKNESPLTAEQAPAPARRGWFAPVITAILVAVALVIGGVGGFAIANATQPDGNHATERGPASQLGGPQGGPQGPQGGPQGPQGGPQGNHGAPQQGPQGGPDGPRDGDRPDGDRPERPEPTGEPEPAPEG